MDNGILESNSEGMEKMKLKWKHVTFDFSWFHLRIRTAKDLIEEVSEFASLLWKVIGVLLGFYFYVFHASFWIMPLILLLFFWLMFDIRLIKNGAREKKALKFLRHIERHIERGDKGISIHAEVMCKICDKTIDEIIEENDEDGC
ncbi:MAG: hypothetical protein OEY47_01280 [Candidatus Bathyarchaeota archaeon]|nr:hypothetical protein [Candidatus Bathyarchaeota archaeon]